MKPKAPCFTIQRLLSLRKGQQMTYYTGHLQYDISRCEGGRVNGRAPNYARQLREIIRVADELMMAGRIRCPIPREHIRIMRIPSKDGSGRMISTKVIVNHYTAEGLR